MKILLLSAYDTASHRYWCKGLQRQFIDVDWTYLSLPARYFSWRIRGNGLSWAYGARAQLEQAFDAVIATSMTDLNSLIGFLPHLGQSQTAVYFHENQFAYPLSDHQVNRLEPQMVNLYAALTADRVLFNSQYNLRTFQQGVQALLKKLPDEVPAGLAEHIAEKSSVLPVPLDDIDPPALATAERRLQVVWNHRWEYDKGPDLLLECVSQLPEHLPICWHVVGQQFRRQPPAFEAINKLLRERNWLGSWGFVENRPAYETLLNQSDVVVSTARHDFQGLSVLEAVQRLCMPLVPDALAYPEWFPAHCLYRSGQVQEMVNKLQYFTELKQQGCLREHIPNVSRLTWKSLASDYRSLLGLSS